MKVILLQDIKGVGKKDEVINASDGYARNFLLPKKMGIEANAENMSKLKAKQDSNQYKKSVEKEKAQLVKAYCIGAMHPFYSAEHHCHWHCRIRYHHVCCHRQVYAV